MKRWYMMLMALFACINLHAQVLDCDTLMSRGKAYAPLFVPQQTDSIMTVRLNFVFIQKSDGSGNFHPDSVDHQNFFNTVLTILNTNIVAELDTNPGSLCYSGNKRDLVRDMRMRFVANRSYIKRDSLWNNNLWKTNRMLNPNPSSYTWYLQGIDDSIYNSLNDTLKTINIYFTEDSTLYDRCWVIQNINDTSQFGNDNTNGGCSMWPSHKYLHTSSRIHMPCLYSKYWWFKNIVPQLHSEGEPQWIPEGLLMFAGSIASGLLHELGHSFNLYHPTEESTSESMYPSRYCTETIMNRTAKERQNFLPPGEIGRMYMHAMTTNMQQFIPYNTYLGTKTLNTTLSLPRMRMYYSLIIGSSGNVTMPCDIAFSTQGSITVQNGGTLSIEGASLHSVQGSWGGIIVQSGGLLSVSDATIDYNIAVQSGSQVLLSDATINCDIVIPSGSSLIVNDDLTIVGDHSITIEDGGYLCVSTSASIDLQDAFSRILISPNAILGCPSCNETCISSRSSLSNTGNGHFITYEGTDYLQNITITSDYMATGNNVMAGYDVTNTKPVGSVIVENGGELRIKANETTLTKDVEVKLGGELLIEN